ncbi:MAG: amino acid racemase [Myxococcales bacterium]|nr:amino acid racemase [Myxococcales bacterium]
MSTHDPKIIEPVEFIKVIGIVGGLGPHAHIEFERRLLSAAAQRLGRPPTDQDYPQWVVSSIPGTPDRTLALLGQAPSPVPHLVRSVERLAAAGADFAVIACNTAHAFLHEVRPRSPIPILDMIEATVARIVATTETPTTVGLLATTGTCRARVYHDRIEHAPGLRLLTPLDLPDGEDLQRRLVMTPIYGPIEGGRHVGGGIKAGICTPAIQAALGEAVERLAEAGARLVICGCTEIPLGLGRDEWAGTPLLDPMEVAAQRAVALATGADAD